jgi:hypothetical protein
MADQQVKITISAIDNATKALNDVKNSLRGIDKETQTTTASFFTFRNILLGTAAVALVALTKQIIDATSKFQDLRSNLISAIGSVQDGGNAFNYLRNYAKETQFTVEELTGAFLTLYQNGVTPTEKTLKTLVSVAGESTNKIETLTQLVNLFSKGSQDANIGVQALGVLLKNNIPVYEILRNKIGGTTDSINGLFTSSTTAKIALDALLQGLQERADKSANRTDNLSTRMSIFNKTIQETLATVGETKAFNYFFDSLTKGFEQNKPLLEFLGNILIGLVNIVTFILSTANKVMYEFFDIFKIYTKPVMDMANAIYKTLTPAFSWFAKEVDKASKSWQVLKNLMGSQTFQPRDPNDTFGSSTATQGLPEAKKVIDTSSELEKGVRATQLELLKVLDTFDKIADTIAKGISGGIKDFSKAIAESIVLGKSLQASFADIARNLLVKIISGLIEEQLIKLALIALDQIAGLLGIQQLYTERLKTQELQKQAVLKARMEEGKASPEEMAKKQLGNIFDVMWEKLVATFGEIYNSITTIFDSMGGYVNSIFSDIGRNIGSIFESLSGSVGEIFSSIGGSLGDILGSVGNMFGGSGGGGGGFDWGTIADIGMMIFGAAEGGTLNAGQPYMVGERGRELFIPNDSGTMIPNQDLGTTGSTSINFTINATDVRGVKELLLDNRSTIVNIMNQALNSKGRPNLV